MKSISSPPLPEIRESNKTHKAAWGAMLAGTALSIYGWTRKSASGAALGVAGGAIALKAASAGPIADLIGSEITAGSSVTIMRPAEELYAFWKDAESVSQWMGHIDRATRLDEAHVHWVRPHPGSGTLEWTTEVTQDIANHAIAWRTASASDSDHEVSGRVEFKEVAAGRGTLVTLTLRYKLRGGLLHSGAASIIGQDPAQEIRENLRRFKMLMEAGEVATINGQCHGPRKLKGKIMEALTGEDESAPVQDGAWQTQTAGVVPSARDQKFAGTGKKTGYFSKAD